MLSANLYCSDAVCRASFEASAESYEELGALFCPHCGSPLYEMADGGLTREEVASPEGVSMSSSGPIRATGYDLESEPGSTAE